MVAVAGSEKTPKVLGPAAAKAARQRGLDHHGQIPRKTIWLAALVMIGLTGLGILAVGAFAPSDTGGGRKDTQGQLTEQGGDKPHIIERPNSGTAPKTNGDRGGWEQLSLLAVLIVAMGGITFMMVRSRGGAQAGRAAWRAAAATGRDDAVGHVDNPDDGPDGYSTGLYDRAGHHPS
jgi:hypothetical protein